MRPGILDGHLLHILATLGPDFAPGWTFDDMGSDLLLLRTHGRNVMLEEAQSIST
jgi:hypothetical protein